ncbi:hypothetical protein O1V64_17920 [Rouxiella badensis]|nr:hypothetical protein O1V64_17920 [Rouxiella badensis]
MDINNAIVTSGVRNIGGRCLLNGVEVPFVTFDVESNSFRSASTFNLTLATSALPDAMGLLNYWSTQTTIKVESLGQVGDAVRYRREKADCRQY